MIWVIGRIGAEPRMYLDASASDASAQIREGEVCFAIAGRPAARVTITPNGASITAYVAPLIEAKAMRWTAAKAYRDLTINGGCPTSFGRADSDETSRNYMRDVLAAGSEDTQWTMADNSEVPVTPDELRTMMREVGLWIAGCQRAAQAIRVAIEAAADAAALEAIDITAGYPAQAGA